MQKKTEITASRCVYAEFGFVNIKLRRPSTEQRRNMISRSFHVERIHTELKLIAHITLYSLHLSLMASKTNGPSHMRRFSQLYAHASVWCLEHKHARTHARSRTACQQMVESKIDCKQVKMHWQSGFVGLVRQFTTSRRWKRALPLRLDSTRRSFRGGKVPRYSGFVASILYFPSARRITSSSERKTVAIHTSPRRKTSTKQVETCLTLPLFVICSSISH